MATLIPRLVPTLDIEHQLAQKEHNVVVGFDEVGRGSLAGPAMVGAVALLARDGEEEAQWRVPSGVADSKILTEVRRQSLLHPLQDWCAAWAVGAVSAGEVDEWGITYALGVAAVRALNEIEMLLTTGRHTELGESGLAALAPNCVISPQWNGTIAGLGSQTPQVPMLARHELKVAGILDGPNDYITPVVSSFDAPELLEPIAVDTLVKADRQCASVAAAAVIAKVIRDELMGNLAHANPQWDDYAWASNKGYGSPAHRSAIAQHGPTAYHRLTWHLF